MDVGATHAAGRVRPARRTPEPRLPVPPTLRAVETRTVPVGDLELSVAEAGAGGRPLLLVHGFTGAKEDFTEWLDDLAERGWHAVVPDLRGHGDSSHPPEESDYSFERFAADALALVDALGWDRFVLLGHSMGGMIAQLVALDAPERVIGLVLMDTHHRGVKLDAALAGLAASVAKADGMEALAAAMDELSRSDDAPLGTQADARVRAERPGYAEFGRRKLLSSSPAMYAAMVEAIVHREGQPDRLDELASLPMPTLVVVGEQDRPFIAASRRMAEAIGDASLAEIPGAGHSPQFEAPEAWWTALTRFLDDRAADWS